MQVHTFTQSLIAYAVFTGQVTLNREQGRASRAELIRKAAGMSDAQKIDADRSVVGALAARFGIRPSKSERPMFSGLTFDQTKDGGKAASVALTRSRAILKTTEEDVEAKVKKTLTVVKHSADKVSQAVAATIRAETLKAKFTAKQKARFASELKAARAA